MTKSIKILVSLLVLGIVALIVYSGFRLKVSVREYASYKQDCLKSKTTSTRGSSTKPSVKLSIELTNECAESVTVAGLTVVGYRRNSDNEIQEQTKHRVSYEMVFNSGKKEVLSEEIIATEDEWSSNLDYKTEPQYEKN